jgi:hypothetical protein
LMKVIINDAQLNGILEGVARDLLLRVSKEILDDFKRDFIEKQIYDVNPSPTVYKNPSSSAQFRNIWGWSEVEKLADSLFMEMKGDYTKLNSIADLYVHSSYSPFGADTTTYLEKLLNQSGRTSHEWSRDSRPYWDNFLSEYVSGGKMKRVIDKHAKAFGFVVPVS